MEVNVCEGADSPSYYQKVGLSGNKQNKAASFFSFVQDNLSCLSKLFRYADNFISPRAKQVREASIGVNVNQKTAAPNRLPVSQRCCYRE